MELYTYIKWCLIIFVGIPAMFYLTSFLCSIAIAIAPFVIILKVLHWLFSSEK